jgi:hypothetical protein
LEHSWTKCIQHFYYLPVTAYLPELAGSSEVSSSNHPFKSIPFDFFPPSNNPTPKMAPPSSQADAPPHGIFPFKKLLSEIRDMIYPHLLILQPDNKPPAFLVALAVDPTLYTEVRALYFKINDSITMNKLKEREYEMIPGKLEVKHLQMVWNKSL